MKEYVYSKTVTLCFLGIGDILCMVFLLLLAVDYRLIIMAEGMFGLLVAGWLIASYIAEQARIRRLQRLMERLEEKYLLGELLPKPQNALERQYFEIIKTISRSAVGLAEQACRDKNEYCEYVESWIHEIKTPLTACSLILANDADRQKLRREIKKADNLTETILYYAKMRTARKEIQIREFSVREVIENAVQSQMELLIAAKIRVETEGDFTVSSDDKALEFILKQLLINSAKYCLGCQIWITAQDRVLTVKDNGRGIAEHDLPQVTKRGFTGSTTQRRHGGTGMGLYIVSGLCDCLGIGLQIDSVQGEYTQVRLQFTK